MEAVLDLVFELGLDARTLIHPDDRANVRAVFDDAVATRYSSTALGDLSKQTARRIPFFGGPAYRKVLGTPAGDLWAEIFVAPSATAPASGSAPMGSGAMLRP